MVGKYRRLCDEYGAMRMLNFDIKVGPTKDGIPLFHAPAFVDMQSLANYGANSLVWSRFSGRRSPWEMGNLSYWI